MAGWGSHTIAQCQRALGLGETSPVEYQYPAKGDFEGQVSQFANGAKPIMSMKGWHGSCGVRYQGSEGWVSVANEIVAHRTMTTNHAINTAMLLKRNVTWDPGTEEFINDPEANRLRSRVMRSPWRL